MCSCVWFPWCWLLVVLCVIWTVECVWMFVHVCCWWVVGWRSVLCVLVCVCCMLSSVSVCGMLVVVVAVGRGLCFGVCWLLVVYWCLVVINGCVLVLD